jgi:sugar phosphate permease
MRLGRIRIYRGWSIVFTGYLAQLSTAGASGWVFGVLILPMQDDLGWSRSTLVGVLTLERLIAGVFGVGLGPMLDRHGARGLMTLSAAIAGSCLVAFALVEAPWQAYALYAVLGLTTPGLSTLGPVVAISNWFVRKRAQAIMFYTFGSATAGLVLAPMMAAVADEISWRAAWLLMGLMLWLVAPLAWLTVRHRPEDVGLRPDGGAPAAPSSAMPPATLDDELERYWTVEKALKSRSFWLLALGFMLISLPASSIFIHMSAFVQSKGFSVEAGAAAVSIYGLGAMAGRFFWGFTVARAGMHRSLVLFGLLYGVSILLYALPSTLLAIYATTVLLGISVAASQQLRSQAFPDYFGRRIVGSLLGYAGIMTMVTGAASPLLAAFAFDQSGSYVATFVFFGVCCLASSAGFFFSKPRMPASAIQPVATA